MGLPTKFAFWFLPRMTVELYEKMLRAWWIVFLASISPSLFLMRWYGPPMLLIFVGAIIVATLAPAVSILVACWAEIRVRDHNHGN